MRRQIYPSVNIPYWVRTYRKVASSNSIRPGTIDLRPDLLLLPTLRFLKMVSQTSIPRASQATDAANGIVASLTNMNAPAATNATAGSGGGVVNTTRNSIFALPPGLRFRPTDVELLLYYLKRKIYGKSLRLNAIASVDIYKTEPWELPGCASPLFFLSLVFPFVQPLHDFGWVVDLLKVSLSGSSFSHIRMFVSNFLLKTCSVARQWHYGNKDLLSAT